ncbi:phosphoribosylaminoimidazolesuccinocarboxamide synthase [Schwartzia succinivorans]|jgi:phosphoribosylaminoimidazole-succinocarboxamide synthase|uniref:Phosphoribosylaminoimidazole-succinocarboxamide synthase n=1 Tax=Schwartzia succinivorans DSM 10502 TaxID=1123243 RepID=A0A1M4THB2_9FIRM|nr:phosphoribosylaminoimidazolesuccinocarboxamide synthase [Schwartzia succinivorans]MBQ1918697.1 phosphoribosylaminoimidazolesuccinocarboxamide synthase [Schwartzia sp. (in: firmicutes)]MBQ3863345.1 phosphoribosylaminoimidazolesuccinocarboxamide synthase [Schwartzia sp. (in: firmicutes)]SHE43851.1 phosphoribosylaminoimidazole-succinocarboxamide synthase [Schwartzia succinivorans DSM 10502]
MEKKEALYEGKAKIIYATDKADELLVYYKDDATAGNGAKKGTIADKGIMNNKMTAFFFELLEKQGIKTHYVSMPSEREMLVKKLDMIPLEVVMRNVAAGSLAERLGLEEGTVLSKPIVELYYKSDKLGDPMLNHYHIQAVGLATPEEVAKVEELGLKVNSILKDFLKEKKVDLIDFKLEFGRYNGEVVLGDEISPDNCRFWDSDTHEKLDKDRFRRDLGNVEGAYKEMLRRLTGEER